MCLLQLLWLKLRLRFWLAEKVELVKTTEKSYGLIAEKICCPMDPVFIDRLLMTSTGSNVKVSHLKPTLTAFN